MSKKQKKFKKFVVEMTVTAEIEISEDLLAGVLTDEWRKSFYNLQTGKEVAGHLAYNLARGADVASLDGFADRTDADVKFKAEWDEDYVKDA